MEAAGIRESGAEVESEKHLYADHEGKEKMVIGPVVLQQVVHDTYCSKDAALPKPKVEQVEKSNPKDAKIETTKETDTKEESTLHELWFDGEGNKTQYLKTLEENGMSLANISNILHGAGPNAPRAFKKLYDLWFDQNGEKTRYLIKMEEIGVDLVRISSILSGVGANARKAFKELYDLWFDQNGRKTGYLLDLEESGVDLVRISKWGRLDIEGRMICEKNTDRFKVFELKEKPVSDIESHQSDGSNAISMVNYKQNLIQHPGGLTAEITENVEVCTEEVHGLGSRSLVEDIGNHDLEEQKSQVQVRFNQDTSTAFNVYNRLKQVTFSDDNSNNPSVWASMDQINSYINHQGIKGANGELAYYIGPNNFGFNSEESIKDIAKHICRRDGITNNLCGSKELDKPFIIVSNTDTVLAQSRTDVNRQVGTHWISWVLLPKKYISLSGKEINNDKYQINFFDSLSQRCFPEGLKKFLTEGGEITESTDTGERQIRLMPFCEAEEIDFKSLKQLTGQQINGNDCGWWATYYALMTVYTGGVEFLEKLKGKKLSAKPLCEIMMSLQESQQLVSLSVRQKNKQSSSDNRQSVQVNKPSNKKQASDYNEDILPEIENIMKDRIFPEIESIMKGGDSEEEKLAKIKRLLIKEPKPDINLQDKDAPLPKPKQRKVEKTNQEDAQTETTANRQQFQEILRSKSINAQEYNKESSNQRKKHTSKQNSKKFKIQKRPGTVGGLNGHFYEIDLLILGRLRGQRDTDKFHLSSNIKGLGAFDDILFRYWNGEQSTIIILQSYHATNINNSKVTIEKFTIPNKKNKLYLGKYFLDYLHNRESFNDKSENPALQINFEELDLKMKNALKCIFYTNAILDERFDQSRITNIGDGILSAKSKEDKDKAFEFKIDDINSDLIKMLENVSCQERVKLLAKAFVSCISGELNYNTMMGDKSISTYHVFLAKNVIDVGKDIKQDKKKSKYREGTINYSFLNIDSKDRLEKVLKEEEYQFEIFFKKDRLEKEIKKDDQLEKEPKDEDRLENKLKEEDQLEKELKDEDRLENKLKEDQLEKEFKKEILYEYAKNVVFSKKSCSGLDYRSDLVNKVIESLKSSKKLDEDVIEKFGGSTIILETKERKLKFANLDKLKDENAKQFIKDLENKVGNLADYRFDIPYELVKKTFKEQTEKEPLKLHVSFGNVSPDIKKPEHLIKKFIELFEKYKSAKTIKIDDSVVGHEKLLTNGDMNNIRKLAGNLLLFDKKEKKLRLASEENLDENALNLIKKLKTTAQQHDLEVDSYRFDIRVKNFPRDTLFIIDEDRTNANGFLSKFEVFTGQASDPELKEIIKDEIRNLYKLTEEEVESSFLKIRNKAEEYWREGTYDLEKDDDFFANILKFNIAFDVRDPVDLFTGREEELDHLHRKMQRSSENRTVISQMTSISGLGGIGKTVLARRYIQIYGKTFYDNNILWVNAEDYTTLTYSFRILAKDKLSISTKNARGEGKDIKSIVQEVYAFFAKRKSLFVFDNAEKSEIFKQFLPLNLSRNERPYVLITSRIARQEWEQWGVKEGITLDVFTDEDAILFVKKALNIDKGNNSQNNDIRKLAIDILHKFPLALVQAVAHIKEENIKSQRRGKEEYTIVKYREDYEKEQKKLLDSGAFQSLDNDYIETTLTTWKVSIYKIKGDEECGQLALKILDIITYFAPENIPIESVFLTLAKENKEKLWNDVELLNRYSMIKLEQGVADIHRLVQEVIRINLVDEKREEETLRKALELIKSCDVERKVNGPSLCIFYPFTKDAKLRNIEIHATYIWSYASKYVQLIKDFYSAYGENANTPIHLFALNGKKDAIEFILQHIEKGKLKDKVNDYNNFGYAPIHTAALNGYKDIVKYLIEEHGVDINFNTRGSELTPTYVAVLGNQLDVVQYLVGEKRANTNVRPFPLLVAALNASKNIIKCLVNSNADILLKDNSTGNNVLHNTLLHLNKCQNHPSDIEEILKYFLEKNSVLVKDSNCMGITPLHFAAECGSARIVQMLLDYGANVNAKSYPAKPMLVDIFDKKGARKELRAAKHVDGYDEGYTALHIAAQKGHEAVALVLLKNGAIYNDVNDDRNTPFIVAEYRSKVEELLDKIYKLFQAVKNGKEVEVRSLLQGIPQDKLEAILNARNTNYKTLINVAGADGQRGLVDFLIKKLKPVQYSNQQQEIVQQVGKVLVEECLPKKS